MFFCSVWKSYQGWPRIFVVLCAIWYHSYNLKNVKNTHEGVLLLVKLQALASNFTKSNTPPCFLFFFFKKKKIVWYLLNGATRHLNKYGRVFQRMTASHWEFYLMPSILFSAIVSVNFQPLVINFWRKKLNSPYY